MKKTLFLSAILATVFVGHPAQALTGWGGTASTGYQNIYCIDSSDATTIDATTKNGTITIVADANSGVTTDLTATVSNFTLKAGQNAEVGNTPSVWSNRDFSSLTIDDIQIQNGGHGGTFSLKTDDTVVLKNVSSGSLAGIQNTDNGGTLTIGGADTTIRLAGSIINAGSMTLYGTFDCDLSNLSAYESYARSITKTDMQTNGYADTYSLSAYALKSNSAVNGAATFTGLDGEGVTAGWSGRNYVFTVVTHGEDSGVYMVNTGTVKNADVAGANRFVVGEGATLSITTTGSAVIEGSGLVKVTKVNDGDAMRGLTLDATNWTGWVSLSGNGGDKGCRIDLMGGNVEIGADGYTGWDKNIWNSTMANNFRLVGTWTNNAFSSKGTTPGVFTGTWTGTGNFIAKTNSGTSMNYTYSGNIAGWEGKFIGGAGTTLLTLSGNAATMNAAVESGTGTLNMKIDTSSLATLNKDITINDLTVAQSSAFNGALTVKGNITQSGGHSLRIFNAADITGSVTMTNMSTFTDKTVTLRGGATISTTMYVGGANADVKFTGDEKTYSFQNLSTGYLTATGAENGTNAADRKVTVGAGATVNISQNINMGWGLTKVTLEDGATLTTGGINYGSDTNCIGSVVMGTDAIFQVGSTHNGTVKTNALTLTGDATMNANLVVNDNGLMDFSNHTELTMGCTVTIGDDVTIKIDDSELASIVSGNSVMTIINDVEGVDMGNLALTLGSGWKFVDAQGNSLDGYNLRLDVVDAGDGKVNIVVAPEPATATLSLLALVGLAARRRRR